MSNPIRTIIDKHLDDANIETILYLNDEQRPCVRMRDLDAEENITVIKCLNMTQALEKYQRLIDPAVGYIMVG